MKKGAHVDAFQSCFAWGRFSALDAFVATLIGNGQLLAALPAAGSQNGTASGRGHTLAEAVLVATLANRGLKSPFHDDGFRKSGAQR
jgi:hypothetical protein